MRMWMVEPEFLCNKHLLGEHGEIHKHKHIFEKKHSILGRIFPKVQIQPLAMEKRHNALALEMLKRGMNHKSPYEMPDLSYLSEEILNAEVDVLESMKDLIDRCVYCKILLQDHPLIEGARNFK